MMLTDNYGINSNLFGGRDNVVYLPCNKLKRGLIMERKNLAVVMSKGDCRKGDRFIVRPGKVV